MSILNPAFKYHPSYDTNVARTIRKAQREIKRAAAVQPVQPPAAAAVPLHLVMPQGCGAETFDDHYIERWARIYQAHKHMRSAVRFDVFLLDPERYVALYSDHRSINVPDDGYLPLLPRQASTQQRIDRHSRRHS
jgi:hypothetical protein